MSPTMMPNNLLTQMFRVYSTASIMQRALFWSAVSMAFFLFAAGTAEAITAATAFGPLAPAVTFLQDLTPGIKAIAVILGFVVAIIALSLLKDFGKVVFFGGIAIFASVGLPVALTIAGFAV
jgi:hypothetical protein